jgi:hypothetical protein
MNKLHLKRETVRQLDPRELQTAVGGAQTVDCSFRFTICAVATCGCVITPQPVA